MNILTLNNLLPFFIILGLGLLLLIVWLVFRRKSLANLNLTTLLITLPQREAQDATEFMRDITQSEQLMASLSSIKEPIAFEMAVHGRGEEIYFYLAVPRVHQDFTSRQIQGFFPDASVEPVPDYTIFSGEVGFHGASFALSESDLLPIRTYKESETDSFAALVSTFSRLKDQGEGVALQLVFKPADNSFKSKAEDVSKRLKKGESFSEVLKSYKTFAPVVTLVKDLATSQKSSADKNLEDKQVDNELVQALEAKLNKPLFEVNVRLISAADTQQKAEDIILSSAGAFGQFASPKRNGFKVIIPKSVKKLIAQYIFREFNKKDSLILNTEEIASIFHLPTVTTDVPRVKWQKTKEAPPPQDLPTEGTLIGESMFRGDEKKILMTDSDRRRHFYVIGQTGTGKSFFMLNQVVQDMKQGKGLCVVDPHGEFVDGVLERVPADRIEDVIVFDPGDVARPSGLNMLEYNFDRPEEKTFIVNEIQSIFNRLFSEESMGPMFEQYMRNALLLLMEDAKHEPPTLMEVPRIFTDEDFRAKKLARITNPAVIDFWEKEASKTTGDQGLANIAPYITSKFGNFISNDYMRPIIGQTKSSFNFREVMDTNKILLVNLAKGKIGDINSGLLGMIVTGRLLLAALSRADMVESERKDFYLYIDEFQNFTTDSISVILSEARKYKLNLILAHQFIAQLTDPIRESVFGNVGSMAAFRVGATDAEPLLKQFSPTFSEADLINIQNAKSHAKLLLNGEPSKPFSMKSVRVDSGVPELKNQLKELSRLTYGRDINQVEQDILRRLRQ